MSVRIRPGEPVDIEVGDDGPGIPPEQLTTLFERFTRGDAARSRDSGGAGLGLALARAITRAHGGDLGATSHPGDTSFTVSLPAEYPSPRYLGGRRPGLLRPPTPMRPSGSDPV